MFEDEDDFREELPDIRGKTYHKMKSCCSIETLKDYLPVLRWLPEYKLSYILNDFFAGFIVALLVVPQSLANASVAGLPLQYGLYSAILGPFIYLIFGSNKNVCVGPTAILALMLNEPLQHNVDLANLLCLITGCILLTFAILKLGIVVQFISMPVITAFLIASPISIASKQMHNLFGFLSPSGSCLQVLIHFFSKIDETKWRDAVLGICTFFVIVGMQELKNIQWKYKIVTTYIALASNALAVITGTLLCYLLRDGKWLPFKVGGKMATGLPEIKAPAVSTTLNGEYLNFSGMLSKLSDALITVPLVATFQCFIALKSFSKGKTINASQDLIAISLSNILGSFLGSIPVSSAFLHTAVNSATNVRTQLGGAVTASIVLLTLSFLTKTFTYLPTSSLAAVNIAAVIPIIRRQNIMDIWHAKKIDMVPFIVTLLCCLLWSLQYGLILGVLVNLLFILWNSLRPNIILTVEKANGIAVLLVDIECYSLDYVSGEYINDKIIKFITKKNLDSINIIILNGAHVKTIDSTVAKNFITLKEDLSILNCELIFWNWNRKAASVIWRFNRNTRRMFHKTESLEEFLLLKSNDNVKSIDIEFETDQNTI